MDLLHAGVYVNQLHLKLIPFLEEKLDSRVWGSISFGDDFASFQSRFSSCLLLLGLILACRNYTKSPLLRSFPFRLDRFAVQELLTVEPTWQGWQGLIACMLHVASALSRMKNTIYTWQCRSALWAQEMNFGWVTGEPSSLDESSQSSHSPSLVHDSHRRVSKQEQIQLLISKLCDGQRFKGVGDGTKERAIARHDWKRNWRLRINLSCFAVWVKSQGPSLHLHVSVQWALLSFDSICYFCNFFLAWNLEC